MSVKNWLIMVELKAFCLRELEPELELELVTKKPAAGQKRTGSSTLDMRQDRSLRQEKREGRFEKGDDERQEL